MSIKIGMFGSSGRVGREVFDLICTDPSLQAEVGVSRYSEGGGYKQNIKSLEDKNAQLADIWVDFSLPEAHNDVVAFCVENKKPLVSGTTGLTEAQKKNLYQAAKTIPVLWSSNMSLGVAVMRRMLPHFASLMNFDLQIEELHHNKKKDSPSGTAKTLQQDLEEHLQKKLPPVLAVRGGGIFGIHRVYAMSEEETITIEHTALNRKVFARGALEAAKWLVQQKPGFYTMNDVLIKETQI